MANWRKYFSGWTIELYREQAGEYRMSAWPQKDVTVMLFVTIEGSNRRGWRAHPEWLDEPYFTDLREGYVEARTDALDLILAEIRKRQAVAK